MRVAWVLPFFDYGQRVLFPQAYVLAKWLEKEGVKTVLVAPKAYDQASHEVIDGIEVFRSSAFGLPVKLFRYPVSVGLYDKLATVVRQLDIDVLNWHGYHHFHAACLPFVKWRLRIPCVMTVIGFPGVNWRYPVRPIHYVARAYSYTLGKAILHSADKTVIDYPSNTDGARRLGLPDEKLEHIPWGIDTELFRPMPEKRLEIRRRLKLEEDDFVIGYCGRLSPVKGIDVLLQSMRSLANNPRVRLLVIGGSLEGSVRNTYENDLRSVLGDRLTITGWMKQNELPLYWQAVDVAIQPSLAESGGGGAMEASACGLPVVASRVGGLQDAVVDGRTGFLIAAGDAEGLSAKLGGLMANPSLRREMGQEGRSYIAGAFGWDYIAKRYIRLYTDLIER